MSEDRHERIARAAADLVNVIYEFDAEPSTMKEPLDALDDLLVEGGYCPAYVAPTEAQINAWIVARVRANGGTPHPGLLPDEEER